MFSEIGVANAMHIVVVPGSSWASFGVQSRPTWRSLGGLFHGSADRIGAGLWILIHGYNPAPDPYVHSIGARLAQPLRVSASVGRKPSLPRVGFAYTPDAQILFVKCPMSPLRDGTGLQWQWSASVACEGAGSD
jgi:hypothetical protein